MINDEVLSRRNRATTSCDDRRKSDRVPYPAELVLAWMHDLTTTIRYRIVDAGDGGFRVRTGEPLIEGMTGMALRLLPEGTPLNKAIMVVWTRRCPETEGYEAGLRYF